PPDEGAGPQAASEAAKRAAKSGEVEIGEAKRVVPARRYHASAGASEPTQTFDVRAEALVMGASPVHAPTTHAPVEFFVFPPRPGLRPRGDLRLVDGLDEAVAPHAPRERAQPSPEREPLEDLRELTVERLASDQAAAMHRLPHEQAPVLDRKSTRLNSSH